MDLSHLPPEKRAEFEAIHARMMAALPFESVTVPGAAALATWERLSDGSRGLPILIGDDEQLEAITERFSIDDPQVFGGAGGPQPRTAEEILAAAAALAFPADMSAWPSAYAKADLGAAIGDWPPAGVMQPPALTISPALLTGEPYPSVYLLLIPAQRNCDIPAYLRWGDWNACPPPEYHVAALREWHARYGAELVGINRDTMNVRVKNRPETREEALALARELYRYCPDIVDQGTSTLSNLAASLMESDWWFFWWD